MAVKRLFLKQYAVPLTASSWWEATSRNQRSSTPSMTRTLSHPPTNLPLTRVRTQTSVDLGSKGMVRKVSPPPTHVWNGPLLQPPFRPEMVFWFSIVASTEDFKKHWPL